MKVVNSRLHYSRAARPLSGHGAAVLFAACAFSVPFFALCGLGAPTCALAQYPGQVTKKSTDTPTLRAVAVLEWTGDLHKPKSSRLVPLTIYDGEKLQDAGLYLARPQPLALTSETEYQLKDNGRTVGLFDVKNAGQQMGSWVGFGDWKAVPHPKPAFAAVGPDFDAEDDDKPVLHRKHHADDDAAKSGADTASKTSDEDGPKLHKKDDSADSGSAPDADRPTLHKKTDDSTSGDTSASTAPSDPDRPVLKKPKEQAQQPTEDVGHVTSLPDITDPDRPRLERGHVTTGPSIQPTLMGLPPDMQQAVAVSDAVNRPDHVWTFSWASPGDQDKMKSALEDIARGALGLNPPAPKTAPATTTRRTASRKTAKPAAPEPAALQDEQFRTFELAYGSGATMVLTADTGGPLAQEKFVTLIAQPDLYGNVGVLLKYVTDGAHLDDNPRMRLVDAVDALADNRGELVFELRGQTSRQFALYRVLRGQAEKLFVTGGGFYGELDGQ